MSATATRTNHQPTDLQARWRFVARVLVAATIVAASLDLLTVAVPDHRTGSTIYFAEYTWWWGPIVACLVAFWLLLPHRFLHRPVPVAMAAVSAGVAAVGGLLAALVAGPVLAWREATLYDHAPVLNVAVAYAYPAGLGVVAMMGAALVAGRLTERRWPEPVFAGLAGFGLAVCVAAAPVAQHVDSWAEWLDQGGSSRLRAVVETGGLAAVALLAGLLVIAPTRLLSLRIVRATAGVASVLCVAGGVLLALTGWLAGTACVVGGSSVADYACPYDLPVIIASTLVFLAGLTLVDRLTGEPDREA